MRHSIKRVSKSALSVILALMMIVSTMVVGMITVNAGIDQDGVYIVCFNHTSPIKSPAVEFFSIMIKLFGLIFWLAGHINA